MGGGHMKTYLQNSLSINLNLLYRKETLGFIFNSFWSKNREEKYDKVNIDFFPLIFLHFLMSLNAKSLWIFHICQYNLLDIHIHNLFCVHKCTFIVFLKGVFAKNERGYRKIIACWSLLILFPSVMSIRRKLLKTTYTE